jgi:hypothetical protein
VTGHGLSYSLQTAKVLTTLNGTIRRAIQLGSSVRSVSPGGGDQVQCVSWRWRSGSMCLLAVAIRFNLSPGGGDQVQCVSWRWRSGSICLLAMAIRFNVYPGGGDQVQCVSRRWRSGSMCLLAVAIRFNVSPGGGDQVQCVSWRWRSGSVVPSSEPLIRVRRKSSPCRLLLRQVCGEADRSVAMRSPCAGAALDPPFWIVPIYTLSLSLSLTVTVTVEAYDLGSWRLLST